MHIKYNTNGVCARIIEYDYDENSGEVSNIQFLGGCPGNLQMISKLLNHKTKEEIISLCLGNLCREKGTSCADQLAKSLLELEKEKA